MKLAACAFRILGLVALCPLAGGQWITENLSEPRSYLAAVGYEGRIYFAGGGATPILDTHSDVVDIYDVSSGTWSIDHLSEPRQALAAGAAGGKVLFAGGFGVLTSSRVDIFDTVTHSWSVANLSAARFNLASASVGSKVLFAGGQGLIPEAASVVDIYDSTTGTWSIHHLSSGRSFLTGVAAGGKAFFAGGSDGHLSDAVDIYDATSGTWTTATLSEPRMSLAASSVGTKVLFAGGVSSQTPSTVFSATVDIYDLQTGIWSTALLSQGRSELAAASQGVRAYFAGGFFGPIGQPSDRVDVYDGPTGSWLTTSLADARRYLAGASASGRLVFAGGHDFNHPGFVFSLADVFVGDDDCDADLIKDWDAVLTGAAADCNENGIPDSCDIDVWGFSGDCNGNGRPDECDPDLDGDSVPDDCVQVLGATGVLASTGDAMLIDGKAFAPTSVVTIDGALKPLVAQTPTQIQVAPGPGDPGLFDLTVTNPVSAATVQDGAELWPSLLGSATGVGGTLSITLDNGEAGLYALGMAFGALPTPIPIANPPTWYGVLLNPAGPLFVISTGSFPTSAPVPLVYPVPSNPTLIGLDLFFQAWCQQGFFGPEVTYSFTNMGAVTL